MSDGRKPIHCIHCGCELGFIPADGPPGRWYINQPAKPVGSDWACVNCHVTGNAKATRRQHEDRQG